ncbi:Vacuolar-sorting protein SNF8 [Nibea albiflora]|uniref:Vacuolar-sorting protein SNF8 n=1 Tax=Nibea albiflora TaxID=240163 RepID=A0ACB7F335_NIBAL|nr:Vacuolar-sorting protein SNF8 [Nibea albiflora]
MVRRYAESTIGSEISKIMDSMVQKNFVDFLLNQKEKKSKPATAEEAAEVRLYSDLLKLSREKQKRKAKYKERGTVLAEDQIVQDHLLKEGLAWLDSQAAGESQYWLPALFSKLTSRDVTPVEANQMTMKRFRHMLQDQAQRQAQKAQVQRQAQKAQVQRQAQKGRAQRQAQKGRAQSHFQT